MKTQALIRVEGSQDIGVGHLIRCLAFAEHLKEEGISSLFITRSPDIIVPVREKGFKIELIDEAYSHEDEFKIIEGKLSEEHNILVLDLNNYKTFETETDYCDYLIGTKTLNAFTLAFEDQNIHPPLSDIAIIPYADVPKPDLLPGECQYLTGPDFFVLPQHFLKTPPLGQINDKVDCILVSMGGSDPKNITLKVLAGLNTAPIDARLVIVIGGFSTLSDNEIGKRLSRYKGDVSIIRDCSNMAELLKKSDLAVISSGLTKYETAYLGVPSIVISFDALHASIMDQFVSHGSVKHLGNTDEVNESMIGNAIVELANNADKRREMSEAGKSLVDGNGIERIFHATMKGLANGKN